MQWLTIINIAVLLEIVAGNKSLRGVSLESWGIYICALLIFL